MCHEGEQEISLCGAWYEYERGGKETLRQRVVSHCVSPSHVIPVVFEAECLTHSWPQYLHFGGETAYYAKLAVQTELPLFAQVIFRSNYCLKTGVRKTFSGPLHTRL